MNENGEGGSDPDVIREMLEDTLVMLGNANARPHVWRQRRFSEFLTDLGKRTLREDISTDKHLFPNQLHEKNKSEHNHKVSNSKLICKPKEGNKPPGRSHYFRGSTHFGRGSRLEKTGKENGHTSLVGQLLNSAEPMEGSDGTQIPPSRLATPAADYPSSVHPLSLPENQTANRLGTSLTNQNFITTDKLVLQAVSRYKIPILRTPRQWRARPTVVHEGRPTGIMREEIRSLITKGAITRVDPCPQHFISTPFLVKKGSGIGKFRPVINFKAINRFLPKENFKMEGLHTVRSLLREGDIIDILNSASRILQC